MSEDSYERDREMTEELFEFLKGNVPEGTIIEESHIPRLTDDQAWTVIWFLGNLYWQVTDHIERCEVCGRIYNTWCEGETNDHPPGPVSVCGNCVDSDEARAQRRIGRKIEANHVKKLRRARASLQYCRKAEKELDAEP